MSGRSATATTADGEPLVLVEANLGEGVVAAPLSKYARFHTRICRPTGLTDDDRARVCAYAAERIGFDYDLKNIIDLMRYPVADAGAAALAPPHDVARLRPPDPHHLLGADRAGLRVGALSDPAQGHAAGERGGAPRRFWRSAIRRFTRRATSTSRPISRWSSRPWCSGFDYKAMAWADLPATDPDSLVVAGAGTMRISCRWRNSTLSSPRRRGPRIEICDEG